MIALEYEVFFRYGKISIRKKGYKKNIRIERAFGSEYTIDRIRERTFENRTKYRQYEKQSFKRIKGFYNLCLLLFPFKNF